MNGTVPESAYQATIGITNAEYEELQQPLNQLQTQTSAEEEIAIYKDDIKQVEEILSLSADDLNDGFYERIPKQIFVYPHNLLEFRLSFIPMPIYTQYKATGKGDFYKVELTILTAEQFAQEVENCSKNELPTAEEYHPDRLNPTETVQRGNYQESGGTCLRFQTVRVNWNWLVVAVFEIT